MMEPLMQIIKQRSKILYFKMQEIKIKDYLKELNMGYVTHSHPAVYTCEEADKYNKNIRGIHSKNLFLKERKSNSFYLIILPANKALNIKQFESLLNEKLKFANVENLKEILNTTPGSVSPFALINDTESKVEIIIDKEVWDSDIVSFHPNINTETLELKGKDFQKYINSLKNKLTII